MSLPCPYKCICSIFFPAVIYFSCFRGWYPARKKLLQSIYFYMYTLYNFWICVNKKALCTQNRPSAGKKCTAGKKKLFYIICLFMSQTPNPKKSFTTIITLAHHYWTAPWWWAEARNSESPERAASVFAFLSVCLFVCLSTSYRSQFSTQQPNFLKICSLWLWEEKIFLGFPKFSFLTFLGHFFTFFQSFFLFVFVLATSHPIRPTNTIFGM